MGIQKIKTEGKQPKLLTNLMLNRSQTSIQPKLNNTWYYIKYLNLLIKGFGEI
jgi:hypothetical protein